MSSIGDKETEVEVIVTPATEPVPEKLPLPAEPAPAEPVTAPA